MQYLEASWAGESALRFGLEVTYYGIKPENFVSEYIDVRANLFGNCELIANNEFLPCGVLRFTTPLVDIHLSFKVPLLENMNHLVEEHE